MTSHHSKNTKEEDSHDVIIEIQEWGTRDQINARSRREYWRSNTNTTECPPLNPPITSNPGKSYSAQDVFLSHSGKQKIFIRQLCTDLTNQGVSCFFDQDRECLPLAEDFPPRIFEAAKTCKVALLLLSLDFLQSKWPMLELSAFIEAKGTTNPNVKILPVFFMILPQVLREFTANNEKWKQLEKSENERAKWEKALNAIRRINGLRFSEGGDEAKFRDQIVKEMWSILPSPTPRYHVPPMQGQARMCQEVSDFFNTFHSDRNDIRVAGLYGIAGQGKTTLGKAFCNFKLGEFEGKVCHLEFSKDDLFKRVKDALDYLTRCPQLRLQTFTDQDKAQVEFYRRVKGQRVLLVLDNVTEESMEEVKFYVEAELGAKSWIILCARSVDLLERLFNIDRKSCMRVPELKEEEAIAILLERACIDKSTLAAEERAVAVKCAQRCSFKEVGLRDHKFHPLALKAFGGYLSSADRCLVTWVDKTEGLADRSVDGLKDLLTLLGKAFDNIGCDYQIIFMLLTLYIPPNMSPHRVTPWLAVILNKEISFTEKAVEDLCRKAFIEESAPKIRIHDIYVEFAQSKANEMRKWLWWKGNPESRRMLISDDKAGFELARLQQCMDKRWSEIAPHHIKNLLVLQLVGVQKLKKLDLDGMCCLRSMTLHWCKHLKAVAGMEKLQQLRWLQISEVNPMFRLPDLSSLKGLQYLEIKFGGSQELNQLADVTGCDYLREVNVCCRSLCEFPRLKGLGNVEKVEFSVYDEVKGPFNFTECVELHSTVIDSRSRWATLVNLSEYKKVSKTVLWDRDAGKAYPDIDVPSALESCSRKEVQVQSFSALKFSPVLKSLESCHRLKNLQLWNFRGVKKLPNFRLLSRLTVLKVGKCGIRDPPDLTSCELLEDVCFSTLENLRSFPNFAGLRKLKKLRIYNCLRVECPPDISGCNELQVLHLVYNDNMRGLPNIGEYRQLENIKLSWQSEEEADICSSAEDDVQSDAVKLKNKTLSNKVEVSSAEEEDVLICRSAEDDVESEIVEFENKTFSNLGELSTPKALKEWGWLEGKNIQGICYVREGKKYYSITAPYESEVQRPVWGKVTVVERVMIHPVWNFLGRMFLPLTCGSCIFAFIKIGVGVEIDISLLTKGSIVSWIIGGFITWIIWFVILRKRLRHAFLPLTKAYICFFLGIGIVRVAPRESIPLPTKGIADILFLILAILMFWIYFLIVYRKRLEVVRLQIMSFLS